MRRLSILFLPLVTAAVLAPSGCRFGYEELVEGPAAGLAGAASSGGGGSPTSSGGVSGPDATGTISSGGAISPGGGGTGGLASGAAGMAGEAGAPAEVGGTAGEGAGPGVAGGTSGGGGATGTGATGATAGSGGSGAGNGSGGSGGSGATLTIDLIVTTSADEADPSATPTNPGQTGFSLREAITFANGAPGAQSITFATVAPIALGSALPQVTAPLHLQGPAAIDATPVATTSTCLEVTASDVLIEGLELHHCKGSPVWFSNAGSSGNQISSCYLHDNSKALVVDGDGAVVFFNSVFFSGDPGIEISGQNAQVLANQVVGSLRSNIVIHTGAHNALVLANLSVGGDNGVAIGTATNAAVWHNTIADPVSSGLDLGGATLVDVRNNIFYQAGTYAIVATDSQLSALDYNLYFGSTSGRCSACTTGPAAVLAAPLFKDAANGDYSLQAGSPAIDAGTDLGSDRNLSGPGLFNGSGPDIGFIEAN